ncbi:MAG: hypothetical protein Q7W30_07855 [Coriobacteriia bacterium]|nr:hypothetical protein [Coriobacteriia bacterium]
MDAKLYVYAYLVLSFLYAAACIQYIAGVSRTVSLAKGCVPGEDDVTPSLEDPDVRESTQAAVRSVLGVDSAAFAVAVIPVAYVAVTGLLGNLLARNTAAAATINPLWLAATLAVIGGHMVFLVRIIGLNGSLKKATDTAVLSRSFVGRHASMFTYYRSFVVLVTVFNVVNSLYILANIGSIVSLNYVM